MPQADLHAKYDRMVFEFEIAFSSARTGGSIVQLSGAGSSQARYTPFWNTILTGFAFEVRGTDGTGPFTAGTYVTFEFMGSGLLGPWTVHATTFQNCTVRLEIDNFRAYSYNGGILEVRIAAARFYVDGVLKWSTGAQYYLQATFFASSALPIIGVPPLWSTSSAVNPAPIFGSAPGGTTPSSASASITTTITGSWTVRETAISSFVGFPMTVSLAEVPALGSCPCNAPPLPTISASNTGSIVLNSHCSTERTTEFFDHVECDQCSNGPAAVPAEFDVYESTERFTSKIASCFSIPDLPASVKKMDPDNYRAVIYRGGFPRTRRQSFATCQTAWPDPDPSDPSETVTEGVHPRQSAILGNVAGTAHALEDTFGYSVLSPAGKQAFEYNAVGYDAVLTSPGVCPVVDPEDPPGTIIPCWDDTPSTCLYQHGTTFAPLIDSDSDNPYMFGILYHTDEVARYVNYWGSRGFSFLYWFPPNTEDTNDDGIPDAQDQWPMHGDAAPVEYWLMKGDQWEYQAALPEGEKTRRRTTLVSAPLVHGCLGLFIQAYMLGVESSFWGDATFKVDDEAPAEEVQLDEDSSAAWTFVDCSGAFDASGVELTPDPGELVVQAEFAMGSFTAKPYLYPHVANRFVFDWFDPNVSSVEIFLVGQSGVSVLIATVKGEVFRPINPSDDKYSGSWAQDFGVQLYTDTGADVLAEGVSAAYMADPELVHAFSLLAGRTAKAIRFVVTALDDAEPVKLKYPVFRISDDPSRVYQENKSQAAIVWPNGPGVRFGNGAFFYDGSHHATPVVLPPGYPPFGMKPSALDWLTTKRLMLLSKAFDEDLPAEIAAMWDQYEATTAAEVDTFSTAFLIPSTDRVFPRAALGNGASCPPLCSAPRRARGADWKPTGAFAQESVSFAVEPRWFVGNDTTHLHYPGDDSRRTTAVASLAGWPATKFLGAVDNSEGYWHIKRGAKWIAYISPWEGCFSVRRKGKIVRYLDLDCFVKLGLMFEGWATDEDITAFAYNLENPKYQKEAVAYESEDVSNLAIVCKADGTILVVFIENDAVKAIRSKSIGEYWSSAVALGFSGKWLSACEDAKRGIEVITVLDHTSGSSGARPWKVFRKLAEDLAFLEIATIVTQAEADVTGGKVEFSSERGRPLVFSYPDSGTPRRFRSFDHGETWVEDS